VLEMRLNSPKHILFSLFFRGCGHIEFKGSDVFYEW